MNQTLNQFEAARGKLFSIAYHMLGSVTDAEDTVQEAYLRYHNAANDAPDEIRSPEAFLSTVVTRLCLNQLQSARTQRETYIGPWLPEPLITEDDVPLAQAQTQESISMAFLVLLERHCAPTWCTPPSARCDSRACSSSPSPRAHATHGARTVWT